MRLSPRRMITSLALMPARSAGLPLVTPDEGVARLAAAEIGNAAEIGSVAAVAHCPLLRLAKMGRIGGVGQGHGDLADQIGHTPHAVDVQKRKVVGRAVILGMAAGEEVHHRDLLGIERRMIAGAETAMFAGDVEPKLFAKPLDEPFELGGGIGAVDDQLVVGQAADHVHVDHGDGFVERHERVADIASTAQQSAFFAGECQEDDSPRQLFGSLRQLAGDLDQHGHARGIVVGPVVDLCEPGSIAPGSP